MEKLKKEIQHAVNSYKSGNLSESEELARKLIASNPKVVFLYNLMGLILIGQNKVNEAVEFYEKGVKIDYRAVHRNTLTNDVQYFPPQERIY